MQHKIHIALGENFKVICSFSLHFIYFHIFPKPPKSFQEQKHRAVCDENYCSEMFYLLSIFFGIKRKKIKKKIEKEL